MQEIIERLIEFGMKYNVLPQIDFEPEIGCMFVKIRFKRKNKAIKKLFEYVPVGDGTINNFRAYNSDFDEVIQNMIKKLDDEDEE